MLEFAQWFASQNGWIDVKKRSPENVGNYLIYTTDGIIDMGYFESGKLAGWGISTTEITHWMPLPNEPI